MTTPSQAKDSMRKALLDMISPDDEGWEPSEKLIQQVNKIADDAIETYDHACRSAQALRASYAQVVDFPLVGKMRRDRARQLVKLAHDNGFVTVSDVKRLLPRHRCKDGVAEQEAYIALLKGMDIRVVDE